MINHWKDFGWVRLRRVEDKMGGFPKGMDFEGINERMPLLSNPLYDRRIGVIPNFDGLFEDPRKLTGYERVELMRSQADQLTSCVRDPTMPASHEDHEEMKRSYLAGNLRRSARLLEIGLNGEYCDGGGI